jgi:cellulose biosynthesis protein BcsQ
VAAGFARAGRRTLAVDCDPQADLSRWLLGHADQDAADLEAIVVGGADPAAAVRPIRVAGLDALPATPRLADITRALAADGIVIPVTASVIGLHGLAGFRDWLASFRTDRIVTAPVRGVLLTQADLDEQGRMRTRVGPRRAGRPRRLPGHWGAAAAGAGARRDGVEDLVSQRLLLGDPAAHTAPGQDVVDAYARLVDYLLERVPAAAGPAAAGLRNECRARRCRRAPAVGQRQLPGGRPG